MFETYHVKMCLVTERRGDGELAISLPAGSYFLARVRVGETQ
jgi:hypothetical protein